MAISRSELKIETFRSKGKGGQNVNKVSSAVRVTHIPTGLVATCQDERSQAQNLARALDVLERRIELKKRLDKLEKDATLRASLNKGRVRTYDIASNRIIDHISGIRTTKVQEVLDGNLDLVRG